MGDKAVIALVLLRLAMHHRSHDEFRRRFGRTPEVIARAPGRVNLIGDHTDYNDGFVLPVAIDLYTWVAAGRRVDNDLCVDSQAMGQTARIAADGSVVDAAGPWANYIRGVSMLLRRAGAPIGGADLCIGGDLSPGAGLASSAALDVATALALMGLFGLPADATGPQTPGLAPILQTLESFAPREDPAPASGRCHNGVAGTARAMRLAQLCQRVEHEFAGSPCGIMDPLCCTSARAGHALLIDCETLKTRHLPLRWGDAKLAVIDTDVRHSIAAGEYARRRAQCAEAVRRLHEAEPGITSLRHVTRQRLERHAGLLGPELTARVRHVVTENQRVRMAGLALESGDGAGLGALMNESHASLRDDYQVSCPELDAAFEAASATAGVLGARMTGGGFGGCVIVLAPAAALEMLDRRLEQEFTSRFDRPARCRPIHSASAAEITWRAEN